MCVKKERERRSEVCVEEEMANRIVVSGDGGVP